MEKNHAIFKMIILRIISEGKGMKLNDTGILLLCAICSAYFSQNKFVCNNKKQQNWLSRADQFPGLVSHDFMEKHYLLKPLKPFR